jgi:hypothetical protein
LDKYKQEDRIIRFHEEDRVLDTIEIELPCIEEWYSKHLGRDVTRDEALAMVDGYGLEPKNQFFKRVEVPSKLKDIYVRIYNKYKKERKYTGIADVPEKDIYDEQPTLLQRRDRVYSAGMVEKKKRILVFYQWSTHIFQRLFLFLYKLLDGR